ncbi:MAG: hypothetical protein AUI57_10675 [Candidatus Rokubacteria bacterium 13_1_40CM_2_68_8]|nr:MAG: hypothetical protein AUI57_10675 [Candidatus Rokubacteria bacterium 13_1_40CM_2_68_8]
MNNRKAGYKVLSLGVVGVLSWLDCTPVAQMQPNIPNGGRAVAVSVHPTNVSHIIVASETGGLFKSTDGGASWTQVSGTTTFGYSDVLYLPTDPNVVIAAAQADMRVTSGGGVWRSTDEGVTWSKGGITPPTAACTNNLAAFALAFEAASSRLWVGTACGLASSTDGGATWQYLPAAPGYSNDLVYAVLAPAANQLKILTDAGLKVSTNSGASWTVSNTGLPSYVVKGVHNQIGVSPFNQGHLYWAFNHWFWNSGTGTWERNHALYRSTDNGTTWSSVLDVGGWNRPPFVKVAQSALSGTPNTYDLYVSDGGCTFERATVTHGTTPTISAWTALVMDHCDPADLGFGTDGRTPVLLASDGGLHVTADNGLHWTFTGAGDKGYWALQITEVTGQLHSGGTGSADLYFGTQDNNLWASPDLGATWPASLCCEGFFLSIWHDILPAAQTKVTGVWCGPCGNFIAGPVFAGATGFPDPPNNAGNPRLLQPGDYDQNTQVSGLTDNIFDLTVNTGGSWTPRYGFTEPVRDLSKVASPVGDPIVFTAVKMPGATPDGQEILGIKRITDVLGTSTPVVSTVTGFGSLGIFPTMFAWYKPFGVDPGDPNYFIVPDIIDGVVKTSIDGGATWQPDTPLSQLVTESGSLRFRDGPFTQVSTVGFDPACAGHILVGTRQAGVMQTFNRGATWKKVKDSERIPNVSAFFFPGHGVAITSSYGRGLWKIIYKCPPPLVFFPPPLGEPTIWWKGGRIPFSQIKNPDACPVCTFFLMEQGRILDYVIDHQSGRIEQVLLSGGRIRGYAWDRKEVPLPFRTATAHQLGSFGGERALVALLSAGKFQAKGLLLDSTRLKGVILASEDVSVSQIPSKRPPAPQIRVDLPATGGIPIGRLDRIPIHGSGFDPNLPVEIRVDGAVVQLEKMPATDARGGFTTSIPPVFGVGGHTILVRQRTSHGVIEDAYAFNVTVEDKR